MISIILPVLNELRHNILERALEAISNQAVEHELIVVDGDSPDGTLKLCSQFTEKIIQAGKSNRAQRMNRGAELAQGDIFLFHHPRTMLPPGALSSLERALDDPEVIGGGFSHSFDDQNHLLLRLTSWYSNHVRARRGLFYLDHCLFMRREVFEDIGGFPDVEIFEDTIFPAELRKRGKVILLPEKVISSAARYRQRGVFKQMMMNQVMKIGFHFGVSPKKLNLLYEGKKPFNVQKSKSTSGQEPI